MASLASRGAGLASRAGGVKSRGGGDGWSVGWKARLAARLSDRVSSQRGEILSRLRAKQDADGADDGAALDLLSDLVAEDVAWHADNRHAGATAPTSPATSASSHHSSPGAASDASVLPHHCVAGIGHDGAAAGCAGAGARRGHSARDGERICDDCASCEVHCGHGSRASGGSVVVGADGEDDDYGALTAEERMDLLLFLQDTLYQPARDTIDAVEADEEAAAAAEVERWEGMMLAEAAEQEDLIRSAEEFLGRVDPRDGSGAAGHDLPVASVDWRSGHAHAHTWGDELLGDCEDEAMGLAGEGGGGGVAGRMTAAEAAAVAVPCPVCGAARLHLAYGVAYCRSCQLRLDVSLRLPLDAVAGVVRDVQARHAGTGCAGPPACQVRQLHGVAAICMVCPACDLLEVVA